MDSKSNDVTNFDNIVLSNLELIRRIGVHYLIRSEELEDFIQEVTLRVYSKREQLRDIQNFPQWLSAIAKNLAVDWNKRRRPDLLEELLDVPNSSPFMKDDSEQWDILLAAIDTLEPIDRDLLYSYYANDVSYAELQARYQLSYMAVGVRLHRVRKQVQERLLAMRNALDKPTPRAGHSAPVVGDKMYLIGGRWSVFNPISSVEEYDPKTGIWIKKTSMPIERMHFDTCAVDGKIYVIGGTGADCVSLSTVEEYNPKLDQWTRKTDMPTPRNSLSITVVNGKIYAIGGFAEYLLQPLPTVEEYDPVTDSWTKKADMPTARGRTATGVVSSKVYVIGGLSTRLKAGEIFRKKFSELAIVEEYDPIADQWTRKADMLTAREGAATVVANEKIYVLGGWKGSRYVYLQPLLATVEEYDPKTDTWSRKNDLSFPRTYFSASVVEEKIYLFGGWGQIFGSPLSSMDTYGTEFLEAEEETQPEQTGRRKRRKG